MNIGIIDIYQEYQFSILRHIKSAKKVKYNYALIGDEEIQHGNRKQIQHDINYLFEDTFVNRHSQFLYASEICKLPQENWLVDAKVLANIKNIESLFYRLTDRSTINGLSTFNRKTLFLLIINYFLSIIKNIKLDVVLTFDTPHSFYSLTLYELLKYKKIPVVKVEYHFIPNLVLLIKNDQYPTTPISYMSEFSRVDSYNSLPRLIYENYNLSNKYFSSYKAKESNRIIHANCFMNQIIFFRYLKKQISNLVVGILHPFLPKQITHFSSLDDIKGGLKYRLKINKQVSLLSRLYRYYQSTATIPDLSVKYIYLGLHMQPEKSSLPMGGEYDNQFLIISTIATSLPSGYKLYVKEHPNQFNEKKIANANFRSKHFYNVVKNIKNVELVSLNVSSDVLISKSKLVATVTGSIGWEALVQGIPVLLFGQAYYIGCNATRHIDSIESCRGEIKELLCLNTEDVKNHLFKYLIFYFNQGLLIEGANWQSILELEGKKSEDKLKNMSINIHESLLFVANQSN